MNIRKTAAIAIIAGISLTACSDDDEAPISVNRVPVFTSTDAVDLPENSAGVVYTATATDADGDSFTFSVDGGADAGAFVFDAAAGTLSIIDNPNFEAPGDANADGQYEVTLRVTDGLGASRTLAITLTITDIDETPGGTRYENVVFDAAVPRLGVQFGEAIVTGGTVPLLMDVYTPFGDTATDRPVVIWAFGGGFTSGERQQLTTIADNFATRGYVSATIDYRTLDSAPTTAADLEVAGYRATHDMLAAVRFFREDGLGANTFGVDPDIIIVGGFSAGALMAVGAGTTDASDPAPSMAVQDFLNTNGGLFGNSSTNTSISSSVQGIISVSGAISNLASIDAMSSPMYAAHEEFDPVVPCDTAPEGSSSTGLVVSGACDMVPAFQAAGVPVEFFFVPGAMTHVGYSIEQFIAILDGAAAFMRREVVDAP